MSSPLRLQFLRTFALRSLIESLHGRRGHPQRQRRIEAAQLQLHELEAAGLSEVLVGEDLVKLIGSADGTVVLRRVIWTKSRREFGVVPIR